MLTRPRALISFLSLLVALTSMNGALAQSPSAESIARGERLYIERCAMCHQVTGQGVPPAFPPLAGSEWVQGDRKRLIAVLCEGLSGEITVKGQKYNNAMPAQILDDAQGADVLNYIGTAWGNSVAAFTAEEFGTARKRTRFKTFEALVGATSYRPLPPSPAGWTVREVVQLPEFCTRFASNGKSAAVYLLTQKGGVYALDASSGALTLVIPASEYLNPNADIVALGVTQDAERRLWVVTNQRVSSPGKLITNEVVIYRTSETREGHPSRPVRWFATEYPYGVGPYNHGVSHLAFGPDGMLYVNSGSRTDGGEAGTSDKLYKGGEVDITACIWRLDPKAAEPKIEIVARGIRNAYGFAWDGAGRLFSVTNGPDAHSPEEMDVVEKGKHYGFPFQFADWPVQPGSPYPHTPVAPEGTEFTLPVRNIGPAAGGKPEGLATFDAHSSPGGMIWCGDDVPEPFRNRFLITRFGNLLTTPEDVGFDLLSAAVEKKESHWEAKIETVLAPLGRPLDVIRAANGNILVLEYTRPTDYKSRLGWLPGRVIELAPKK